MSDVDGRLGRLATGWLSAIAVVVGGAIWLGALSANNSHQDEVIADLKREQELEIQRLERRIERLERAVFRFPG